MHDVKSTTEVETHTPGPWSVRYERLQYIVTSPSGDNVACLERWTPATELADAHLISAAPELLAALKGVLAGFEAQAFVRNVEGDERPDWAIKLLPHFQALAAANVAIAKAEGGAR